MVTGVRLVDAGVADRAAVVFPHRHRVVADRRRDDIDALRVRVELRGREVGGEGDDVAEVFGRREDVYPLVIWHRHDLPVDEVTSTADHDVAIGLESLLEGRGMVFLDALDDGSLVDR